MALLWLRNDSRLFGIVFVLFNVLLAVFNILNYRVTSRTTVPCVVIVAPTSRPLVEETTPVASLKHISHGSQTREPLRMSTTPPPPTDTTQSSSTVVLTRRLVNNANTTTAVNNTVSNSIAVPWDVELRGKYLVVKNYISANGDPPGFNDSVTLSTQGTYEFLHHIEPLCKRWDGPVSVAVYAPGTDLPVAVRKILFLRECGHPCVQKNVSWHMIFDSVLGPTASQLAPPNDTSELEEPINCTAGMKALDLVSDIRKSKKMPYPINVARNVARQQAKTKYVLASDIELYPSINIVSRFIRLVRRNRANSAKPHVYTLPIFEIKKEFPPPETKTELIYRIGQGHAIFFHKWVCDACQNFPKRNEWLKHIPDNDSLSVFHITKRQQPRTAWEPIYIGTNAEPLYDERLTWEGKRDKMSQMYELCLLDYDFYILDNAFLVHAPGIKTLNTQDQRKRAPFMHKNNAVHNKLLDEMRKKYGVRKGC